MQPHEDLPAFLPFGAGVADGVAAYVHGSAPDVVDWMGQSPTAIVAAFVHPGLLHGEALEQRYMEVFNRLLQLAVHVQVAVEVLFRQGLELSRFRIRTAIGPTKVGEMGKSHNVASSTNVSSWNSSEAAGTLS